MRIGNLLMILGGVILLIGVLVRYAPGMFGWFGNLPGDIRIESENSSVFIPIASMIIVSIGLTLIVNAVRWFLEDR
jgi:heme/copper-type cytochrome/quinol oxidase subunit 1